MAEPLSTSVEELAGCISEQLDRDDAVPLNHQIEQALTGLIDEGRLRAGDRLPGDIEFARLLGVNTRSIRRAYQRLQERNLIERKPRAGTFVSRHAIIYTPYIGFYFPDKAENHGRMLERAGDIQRLLQAHQYNLQLRMLQAHELIPRRLWVDIQRCQLVGMIMVVDRTEAARDVALLLESKKFPLVRLGSDAWQDELQSPLVTGDETQGVRDGIAHLRQHGHQHIGLLYYRPNTAVEYHRQMAAQGFEPRWLRQIPFSGGPGKWAKSPYHRDVIQYLVEQTDITAVIAESPMVAVECLRAWSAIGHPHSHRLSVLTLSDTYGLGMMSMPVSTMTSDSRTMAETSATLLLQQLSNKPLTASKSVLIPYELLDQGTITHAAVPVV